jgi:GeoRSP system SPASM domain protein
MNLKELTWPIRIYWDLLETSPNPAYCLKVCDELLEIKILFLSLRVGALSAIHSCVDILDRLKGRNIGLSLTVAKSAMNASTLEQLKCNPVKILLAEVSSLHDLQSLLTDTVRDGKGDLSFGISFEVGQNNIRELADVISCCMQNGIRDLVFPIQRLEAGKVFFTSRNDREEVLRKLEGLDYRRLSLTIHDPFLWEIFFPDADYHEGGCQAANSMLYISPSYKVWPCPAMPFELGDLHEITLREIILSEEKKQLRSLLLSPPGECAVCGRSEKCLGGCRGRAYALTGSLDRTDPAC